MTTLVLLLALVVASTPKAPVPGAFPNAVALAGETQEDAPAVEIYLTPAPWAGPAPPARPYLHIEIARGAWVGRLGTDLELVPLSRHGLDPSRPIVRAEIALPGAQPAWLTGRIRLTAVEPGVRAEGSYAFVGPGGRCWTGTFKASWMAPRSGGSPEDSRREPRR